jgi:tetratricopeptide (TPR) repeat protein
MTTFMDEVAAAAIELARGARWDRALALLDAAAEQAGQTDGEAYGRIALAAATVALDRDWWVGTDTAGMRLAAAERAGVRGWQLDFVRLRRDYLRLIHPAGGTFQPGPWGKDPEVIADLERRAGELRRTAAGEVEAGWAEMYAGLVADNLRADRQAAPAHYEAALAAAGRDDLLAREALRHLGDHDHDNGDHAAALDRWQRATALGAGAGYVTGTLSQQLLLAVLARDAGDETAADVVAAEVARWAGALGATRIRVNAESFRSGIDPTAAPEEASAR